MRLFVFACGLLLAALPARADFLGHPAPLPQGTVSLRDGDLTLDVVRLPEVRDGRQSLDVRVSDGTRFRASVGHGAVVQLASSSWPTPGQALVWGIKPIRPLMPSLGLFLVESVDDEDGLALAARLQARRGHEGLVDAQPDLWRGHKRLADPFKPNDPQYLSQWFFTDLKMPDAWALSRGAATTTIVVVDDGCDTNHPDLKGKMDPGRDVVDGDDDPSYAPHEQENSHGTACAGLAAAATNNQLGVAGTCPECRLRCVRLLGTATSQVPLSADVDAFQFALDVDAAVVSNSWGYDTPAPAPTMLASAINQVADHGRGGKGALVFFASGNENRMVGQKELLGVRGVIGVGAITHFAERTQYSNFGPPVDLVAPTGAVTTDISGADGSEPGDYTTDFNGTSSACPVAAGIGALLTSVAPDRTAAELTEILRTTARKTPFAQPDQNGHDDNYGYGIIDPVAALAQLVPQDQPDAGDPGSAGDSGGCGCSSALAGWLLLVPLALRRRQ